MMSLDTAVEWACVLYQSEIANAMPHQGTGATVYANAETIVCLLVVPCPVCVPSHPVPQPVPFHVVRFATHPFG